MASDFTPQKDCPCIKDACLDWPQGTTQKVLHSNLDFPSYQCNLEPMNLKSLSLTFSSFKWGLFTRKAP